ncbi:MAG: LysR family transcriptional regulator [Paucimonas sp.]|nr:LysR family transcriptional regulator [Paucimonas sp.]
MIRKLPPLNAVRAFEVAARHVSFTRAAEELNVTHGAVSRQVALLEEWLGKELFRRSASQLSLTEAGRTYLSEVSAVLDRLAVASMYVREQAGPTAFHINAPPTFTMRWLIARMAGFQRKHPDVEIRLTTSLAPVNFQEHGYDVAIRGAQAPLEGCSSLPFMTEIIAPVCHVDLLGGARALEPADLERQALISYATEPYAWRDWLAELGHEDLRPASTLQFEQMFFALQAAQEGLGIVLVPLFLAIDDILAGRLCAPFGLQGARKRSYYANFSTSSASYPVVRGFYEWLMREGHDTEQSILSWAESAGARLE